MVLRSGGVSEVFGLMVLGVGGLVGWSGGGEWVGAGGVAGGGWGGWALPNLLTSVRPVRKLWV